MSSSDSHESDANPREKNSPERLTSSPPPVHPTGEKRKKEKEKPKASCVRIRPPETQKAAKLLEGVCYDLEIWPQKPPELPLQELPDQRSTGPPKPPPPPQPRPPLTGTSKGKTIESLRGIPPLVLWTPCSSEVIFTPMGILDGAKVLESVCYDQGIRLLEPAEAEDQLWTSEMMKKLNEAHPRLHPARPCTIFKVPKIIRYTDSEAYAPTVVGIGAFNHAQGQQLDSMPEHYKWRCVRYLLSRHGNTDRAGTLFDQCLMQMKARDADVRNCYSEPLQYLSVRELASTMLLDGCFILYLMLKQVDDDNDDDDRVVEVKIEGNNNGVGTHDHQGSLDQEDMKMLHMGSKKEKIGEGPLLGMLWSWNLIIYDLLKLENQIPFFIINVLFQLLRTSDDQHLDLVDLALRLFQEIHPSKSTESKMLPVNRIHHLLHLFHSSIVPPKGQREAIVNSAKFPEWIPNAIELQRGGIKFKKKKGANSFLDVSFRDGTIEIPQLRVYDYTNSLFRNLIAFEQCYADTMTHVTIYAAFMDCIIDDAEDVKFLGLNGVVVNRLSTDEAMANLFNQLCNQVHYSSDRNYLEDVFVKVKKYHESKWHQWRSALMRDYFNNPWAGISVVAAVLLLLLTVHQSVFAVLSYK